MCSGSAGRRLAQAQQAPGGIPPTPYQGPAQPVQPVSNVEGYGGYYTPPATGYGGAAAYPAGYPYQPGYGNGPPAPAYGPGSASGPMVPFGYGVEAPPPGMLAPEGPEPTGPSAVARNEFWFVNLNYLGVLLKQGPLNTPLVTTGSPQDTPAAALGQPGTAVLFGANNFNVGLQQGLQGATGFYLDKDHHFSIEAEGLGIFPDHIRSTFASDALGNPVIARPVYNTFTMTEGRFLTSFPGELTGSTAIDYRTNLWAFKVNARWNSCIAPHLNVEFLGGYREMNLNEKLTIQDSVIPLVPGDLTFLGSPNLGAINGVFVNPPSSISDQDVFATNNTFYGVNLGARLRFQYDWFFFTPYVKVGVGVTEEKVQIQGSTSLITPGAATQTTAGGILAQPSNIGTYTRSIFGVIPEAGFTLGVEPINHVRLTAGYSFLFWNRVVRPGNQVDRNINPGQVPTDNNYGLVNPSPNPLFSFKDQGFWLQTLNVGLEFYY